MVNPLQHVLSRLESKATVKQMTKVDQVVKVLDLSSKSKGSLNSVAVLTLQLRKIKSCRTKRGAMFIQVNS